MLVIVRMLVTGRMRVKCEFLASSNDQNDSNDDEWNAYPLRRRQNVAASVVSSPELDDKAQNAVGDEEKGRALSLVLSAFSLIEPEESEDEKGTEQFVELSRVNSE